MSSNKGKTEKNSFRKLSILVSRFFFCFSRWAHYNLTESGSNYLFFGSNINYWNGKLKPSFHFLSLSLQTFGKNFLLFFSISFDFLQVNSITREDINYNWSIIQTFRRQTNSFLLKFFFFDWRIIQTERKGCNFILGKTRTRRERKERSNIEQRKTKKEFFISFHFLEKKIINVDDDDCACDKPDQTFFFRL